MDNNYKEFVLKAIERFETSINLDVMRASYPAEKWRDTVSDIVRIKLKDAFNSDHQDESERYDVG